MSDPKSPLGLASSDLFNIALLIATLILLGVGGVILYSIMRFRGRSGEDAPIQDFGNRRLEIAWTLGPALVLAVMAVFTWQALSQQEVDASKSAAEENRPPDLWVIGHQWWWEFR